VLACEAAVAIVINVHARCPCCRYYDNLNDAREVGMKKGYANGLGLGAVFLVMFGSYALAFWYGSTLVREEGYTPGNMMIVSELHTVLASFTIAITITKKVAFR